MTAGAGGMAQWLKALVRVPAPRGGSQPSVILVLRDPSPPRAVGTQYTNAHGNKTPIHIQ